MPEVQWYYARNDEQFGPVSASELKQMADAGKLSPDDLLWREGMEAWTTAVNLRGLFGEPDPPQAAQTPLPQELKDVVVRPAVATLRTRASLQLILRTTQAVLWGMCVLVVLAGIILFTRAFLVATTPQEEAAAGVVYSTFFLGAYVLARCGEKLSRLLLTHSRRRSKR